MSYYTSRFMEEKVKAETLRNDLLIVTQPAKEQSCNPRLPDSKIHTLTVVGGKEKSFVNWVS